MEASVIFLVSRDGPRKPAFLSGQDYGMVIEAMRDLDRLRQDVFDVIVIGGGITGAFAAWDASLRGLSVALFERHDFGGATSAHSLKFVHGGIRYLQHLDFPRLRESCRERSAFLRMAPHLVAPIPVVVPCFGHGLAGTEAFRAALLALNLLTLDRNRGIRDPNRRIGRGEILSRRECLRLYPDLDRPDLTGAAVFEDGHIYNPTRLVYSVIDAARSEGAEIFNYCEALDLTTRGGHVTGVMVRDFETGQASHVRGRTILNCAGPYAEQLLINTGRSKVRETPLSRDMAVVISRNLVGDSALAVQTRYRDPDAILKRGNRHVFMVPWRQFTLIGVHSRVYAGDPYRLGITEDEVLEFLNEINAARPSLGLSLADVTMVNYGLLPFGENAENSRNLSFGKRSQLIDHGSRGGPDGLITAMSVRLTMGRATGEAAVRLAASKLGLPRQRVSPTMETCVAGGDIPRMDELLARVRRRLPGSLDARIVAALVRNHGAAVNRIIGLIDERPQLAEPIPGSTVLRAEVVNAVRHEQARYLSDIVMRRTDLGTGAFPEPGALESCAELAASELHWNGARKIEEINAVKRLYPDWLTRSDSTHPGVAVS